MRDDAKLHNYLQLANDEGEKLLRNNEDEDENLYFPLF